jgi:prepilin-type N-terminal cleavage/methylation domain-containing protein
MRSHRTTAIGAVRRRLVDPFRRDETGTSLVEMLVALSIFGILSTALLGLLLSTVQTSRVSEGRTVASQLASSYVDETRAEGAVSVSPGRTTLNRTVDGRNYLLTRDAQFVVRGQASTSCSSPGNPSYLRVRIRVTWDGMGSAKPVETNTVVTPSVGDVDDTTGNVAVSVVDRDGAPLADVPVTLTPGTTAGAGDVQTTTTEGCAYFAFVSPGTYTASLTKAGFTDIQRRATPTSTTSVSASQTATISMQFDQSASVRLLPSTDAAHPAPNNLAYTLYSTTFTNATNTLAVAPSALPVTVGSLFPVAAGYQGWAGRCTSNDPGVLNRVPPAPTTRGGTSDLNVPMARFDIVATRSGLPPTGAWSVTATQTATDVGCPTTQAYTWTSTTPTTLGGALPFGSWTFTVTDSLGSKTTSAVVFSPTTSTVTTVSVSL